MRRLTIRPIYLDVLSKVDGAHVATHDITYWTDEATDALVASIDYDTCWIKVRSYPRAAIAA
jgi:hypothetical protein